MPNTVKAKLLLGWMKEHEALKTLNNCYFEKHLSDRAAKKMWRHYRDKVTALPPRNPMEPPGIPFTATEKTATGNHMQVIASSGHTANYNAEVIKINPAELVARQFYVVVGQSEVYAANMMDETTRINHCLGNGLKFTGQLVSRQIRPDLILVDLPHMEFLPGPSGFIQRDRYLMAVRTQTGRLLLWGGYHRVHAILCCQGAGEAPGVAPLLTVMTGIPEVQAFLTLPSSVREMVLGDRPALLRDFLDEELFITVNLRKMRAEGRVELRNGQWRAKVNLVPDNR
jgi:hypothetical protein